MKHLMIVVAIAVVAMPIAAVVTFVLNPVWSWFERTTGIESIGHSGPATWCYVAVYLIVFALGLAVRHALRRRG